MAFTKLQVANDRFVEGMEHSDNSQHPHLTPAETWKTLFEPSTTPSEDPGHAGIVEKLQKPTRLFEPSQSRSFDEILRLLRENEKDTVTIIAIGPLTNLALAAAKDPETFLRVKEVVVMGGTIDETGNVRTPSLRAR